MSGELFTIRAPNPKVGPMALRLRGLRVPVRLQTQPAPATNTEFVMPTYARRTSRNAGPMVLRRTRWAHSICERGWQNIAPTVATETDVALDVGLSKHVTPPIAGETDTAVALVLTKRLTPGIAGETDTAIAVGLSKHLPPVVAVESDTALTLGKTKRIAPPLAPETDSGLTLGRTKRLVTTPATEIDTALTLDGDFGSPPVTSVACTIAAETDEAMTLPVRVFRPVEPDTGTDSPDPEVPEPTDDPAYDEPQFVETRDRHDADPFVEAGDDADTDPFVETPDDYDVPPFTEDRT